MPIFSQRSKDRLATCDERLQRLMNEVIKHKDIIVLEGRRSIEKQKEYVAKGTSKTMKSYHLHNPSLAVDVAPYVKGVPGGVDWNDIEGFKEMGNFIKGAAAVMEIPITWGGDWHSFKDYPHFQLPRG